MKEYIVSALAFNESESFFNNYRVQFLKKGVAAAILFVVELKEQVL
jgi:hypothetical protein